MGTATVSSEAFVAESAQAWEHAGLLYLENEDRASAIPALGLSIAYGSDAAMLWLGFTLIDEAYARNDMGAYFTGLAWLYIASQAGVPHAAERYERYLNLLTDDLLKIWAVHTPYAWLGVGLN